jgi:aspartyl-tRNA(Asn)/glutamyl-tRNA(Gln) amidotransferase subunit C
MRQSTETNRLFIQHVAMQVDAALISRLERLARLQLTDAERTQFAGDLTNILALVDQLQTLDTEGVEPLAYLTGQANPMREDAVGAQLSTDDALRNAPRHDEQFFRVPKVIS